MQSTSTPPQLLKKMFLAIVFTGYFIYAGSLKAHPTAFATVGDFVWVDQNGNGIQDSGEPGVANLTVQLLNSAGTVVATTTTNSSGKYSFTNIAVTSCAKFRVQFGTPGQYTWTTKQVAGSTIFNNSNADENGLTDEFTLCDGNNNPCVDAGIIQSPGGTACIGDFVFVDLNKNGKQDSGEPGVANVTVKLINSSGTAVATTTTNALGKYFLTNVPISSCGQYKVQFGTPGQYTFTTKEAPGTTATNNSNADVNGFTSAFTVCPGYYTTCIDAGIIYTPNLTVSIEYLPSITHGKQTISVITTISETKHVATDSTITVYIAKDDKYTITYNQGATTVSGIPVNNSNYTLDATSNASFYIFRSNTVIPGGGTVKFGFDVFFDPKNSNGSTTITAIIDTRSGGETPADANDNNDADVLDYFLN